MRFDVIVGNPPYQINDGGGGGGASASPVYQKFVEAAIDMDPRFVSMIVPSRWFAGGKGLDQFRARMIGDQRMSHIVDYPDATECFPGVEIKGGVNYFLWDRDHTGGCRITTNRRGATPSTMVRLLAGYDILVRHNEAVSILEKVRAEGGATLDRQVSSRKPFGFASDFKEFSETPMDQSVKLYAWKRVGHVDRALISANLGWVDKHKVLLGKAYNGGEHTPHQITGSPIVTTPGAACTETYLVCGVFDTRAEAENLAAFMRTRFARFLTSLRKPSQNMSKSVFSFVPALDMTVTWTDEMLYARYNLTADEIAFIESQIKEMP